MGSFLRRTSKTPHFWADRVKIQPVTVSDEVHHIGSGLDPLEVIMPVPWYTDLILTGRADGDLLRARVRLVEPLERIFSHGPGIWNQPEVKWAVYRFECPECKDIRDGRPSAIEFADHHRRAPETMGAGRCALGHDFVFVEKRPLYEN